MKNVLVVLKKLAPFCLLMIALPAAGAGGAGTQGPRFLGAGLDEAPALSGLSGGGYSTSGVQDYQMTPAQFPPQGGTTLTPTVAANVPLHSLRCTKDPANDRLANCTAKFAPQAAAPGPIGSVCKESH